MQNKKNNRLYIVLGKIVIHQSMISGMPASPEKFRNLLGELEKFTGCTSDELKEAYAFLASQSIQSSFYGNNEMTPVGFKLDAEKK
ncbi:MAG: hypothetical protein WCO58_00370 [bacterium]